MDTKNYNTNRIFYWATEIFLTLVSVVSLFLDVKGLYPRIDWQWIAIGALLIFALTAFRHIILIEGDLLSKTPRIVTAKPPYFEYVQMDSGKQIIISSKGEMVNRNISRFLKIAFANAPKHNTENNHARRVAARITYKDAKNNILVGPIYARWSNSIQPKNRDDLKELMFRDLDSSGKEEPIDIAFKIDSEDKCYAYNSDSYFFSDLKNPSFELSSQIVNVTIEIIGERVKRKNFYELRFFNDGKNMPIRIEERKSWFTKLLRKQKLPSS